MAGIVLEAGTKAYLDSVGYLPMTVAISCNLSDGVILGVDSAVTVPVADHVKIWENAEKLFQMGGRPIGAAIYGLAGFGDRSVGSYSENLRKPIPAEFEKPTMTAR
jgi:hypothetical protein